MCGGAAINALCRQLGIETRIVDAGVRGPKATGVIDQRVAEGTQNFLKGPAMLSEQANTAIERGIELAKDAASEFDLVGVGEMGIGNTTSASAILCAVTGATPEETAGRGTGLDEAGIARKREVLERALATHRTDPRDPLSIVSAFAGFEIAMMAGFILGCAAQGLAVIIDGFISGAAFLIARSFHPDIARHVLFGHRSAERGHSLMLAEANARPLLHLDLCLGEGTGAALAIGLLTSAAAIYSGMATFAQAAVSDI